MAIPLPKETKLGTKQVSYRLHDTLFAKDACVTQVLYVVIAYAMQPFPSTFLNHSINSLCMTFHIHAM